MAVTDQQFLDHSNQNNEEFQNRQILLKGTTDPDQGAGVPAPISAMFINLDTLDRFEKVNSNDIGWIPISLTGGSGEAVIQSKICIVSDAVGDLVAYHPTVDNGIIKLTTNTSVRRCIGVILSKVSDTEARVLLMGKVDSLSGLSPGARVYLSPTGNITSTLPTSGYLQTLGEAISTTEINFVPSTERVKLHS